MSPPLRRWLSVTEAYVVLHLFAAKEEKSNTSLNDTNEDVNGESRTGSVKSEKINRGDRSIRSRSHKEEPRRRSRENGKARSGVLTFAQIKVIIYENSGEFFFKMIVVSTAMTVHRLITVTTQFACIIDKFVERSMKKNWVVQQRAIRRPWHGCYFHFVLLSVATCCR